MILNEIPITVAGTLRISQKIHNLLIKVTGESIGDDKLEALNGSTIKIDKISKNGTVPLIPETSLMHIVEFGSVLETTINVKSQTLIGTILLGVDGTIRVNDNDEYKVVIKGLAAGLSLTAYATENLKEATRVFDYVPARINANTPTSIGITESLIVFVPVGFTQIELHYPTTKITLTEVEALDRARILNAGFINIDGYDYAGGQNFVPVEVTSATTIVVYHNEDCNLYKLNQKSVY